MAANSIQEIKESFVPQLKLDELQALVKNQQQVRSDAFYALAETLAGHYQPSFQDKYEARWDYFYLPVERGGTLICTAVSLFFSYKKLYYLTFVDLARYGGVAIDKGADPVPEGYDKVMAEINRFLPLVIDQGAPLIEAIYPYEWRPGRIKRKYVVEPKRLWSKAEGKALLTAYRQHLAKGLTVSEISVNDYLETAAICYRAAFAEDIEKLLYHMDRSELTPRNLHKQWADNRHGGMFFLKEFDSKAEFMEWYLSRKWQDAHPFEIVYSGNVHGISLYPPEPKELHYRLSVIDPFYNDALCKMVAALIEHNVPFVVHNLKELVQYVVGEAYLPVNTMSMREMPISYTDSPADRKRYFPHIEWDALKMLEATS